MKKKISIKFLFDEPLLSWYQFFFTDLLKDNYELIINENPDYVIGAIHQFRAVEYNCIRIGFAAENVRPDFNLWDYAIGFDHIQFEDRYVRFPLYLLYSSSLEKALKRHLEIGPSLLVHKKRFCNFVVSNGNASEKRTLFFDLLSKYKKVDSGGKFLNNVGGPIEDKFLFQLNYRFSICFENSSSPGYLTEKIIEAAAAKTIPIYWGDPSATLPLIEKGGGLNRRAFINVFEYDNLHEVVNEVVRMDQQPELILNMLSEPLFLDVNHDEIFVEKLRCFMINIFDQDIQNAYRRGFGQARMGMENFIKGMLSLRRTSNLVRELSRRLVRKFI